ncbi:hypothetical protein BDK51DRAFT_46918 [Blyttiomyces helicus]|uniref:Uncharacterized protein n=1 Tax=Blyttiomyces helicus TaxID=388810 RepID=A0A4P9WHL2_9FUNG|nr:hypothetical protein BDK51DRAFT_46918 [Blyttiomyces helicus]|eukprot:RKO92224.1 hypothetical protein BDK51DRAFT_46918 [Blyttiomyces helicus]
MTGDVFGNGVRRRNLLSDSSPPPQTVRPPPNRARAQQTLQHLRKFPSALFTAVATLRAFMAGNRASSRRFAGGEQRAAIVRVLELDDVDWAQIAEDDFTEFIPHLKGLRALAVLDEPEKHRPPTVAAIATILLSCPHLVALHTPIPRLAHRWMKGEPPLESIAGFDKMVVARGVAKLKSLHLAGFESRHPRAEDLPNWDVQLEGYYYRLLDKIKDVAVPLRRVTFSPTSELCIPLDNAIRDENLDVLWRHPPLTFLRISLPQQAVCLLTEDHLEQILRARGSNLEILDLSSICFVDPAFLVHIAASVSRHKILFLESYLTLHNGRPPGSFQGERCSVHRDTHEPLPELALCRSRRQRGARFV